LWLPINSTCRLSLSVAATKGGRSCSISNPP
jgi:hypothetical protein